MTHPLKTYLERHSVTEAEFASRVRVDGESTTASYISQIIIGYRNPGGPLALAIADATGGSVTVDELLRFKKAKQALRPRKAKRAA